ESANASAWNGRAAAAWTDQAAFLNFDIRARISDASGSWIGPDFLVANSPKPDHHPAAGMDFWGKFVVGWTLNIPDTEQRAPARLYLANGTPDPAKPTEFSIASSLLPEFDPSVAMDAAGNFVVSYTKGDATGNGRVMARMFDATGNFIKEISVSDSALF